MTQGELKFALEFEHVLNCIPQPEYRQLMVEAIMVLTLLAEHNVVTFINKVISVDGLVQHAYKVFLEDQCGRRRAAGDVWRRDGRRSDRQHRVRELGEFRQAFVGGRGEDHAHVDRESL
ncbi:hypothetical protein HPB50_002707 [Hyalomma asiaticum]|uniref:Uncharacterized protein n=1 Tax=Hyalomma asiaticum TaxID=266040 RepID=A0ACB7THM3_HYAAI|nr:hypothetical protein HPB50_002707 [Hyalomma asiaticum]